MSIVRHPGWSPNPWACYGGEAAKGGGVYRRQLATAIDVRQCRERLEVMGVEAQHVAHAPDALVS